VTVSSRTIRDLLAAQPVLAGLEAGDLDLMAGCGRNRVAEVGAFLASEDDPADQFFVLRAGRVALEIDSPTGPLVIETIGPGQLVGWSWIFPPHRWVYDVEVLEEAHVVAIDAACLRAKCDSDTAFGYRVMQRFAQVVAERLAATRLRLLDLYGSGDAR
jgi:CRP/FNR family transcriptional regulator, cyclic AMP receptor protein